MVVSQVTSFDCVGPVFPRAAFANLAKVTVILSIGKVHW